MSLSEELRFWAQNEEMIDQFYTQHGKDCLSAADELDRHRAYPRLVEALRYVALSAVWDGRDALTGRREYVVHETEIEKARALLREIGEEA